MAAEGEQNEYNRAYEALVSEDDDVTGLVAYAIYKQDKRDFLVRWREQHGAPPAPEEVRAFATTVLGPGQRQRYRVAARTILDAYASAVLEAERPLIAREAVTGRIEEAAERVEQAAVWWRQIPTGVIAALLYTVLLICVVVALRFAGIDLLSVLQEVGPSGATQ